MIYNKVRVRELDKLNNIKYSTYPVLRFSHSREKQYLCSPIIGERLRIPVGCVLIAVSLAGHSG